MKYGSVHRPSVGNESRRGASELNFRHSFIACFTPECRRIMGTRSPSKSQGKTPAIFLFCSNESMCFLSMESVFHRRQDIQGLASSDLNNLTSTLVLDGGGKRLVIGQERL